MTFRNDLSETGWIHTVTVLKMCLNSFTTVTRKNVGFLDIRQNETSFSTFIKFIFSQYCLELLMLPLSAAANGISCYWKHTDSRLQKYMHSM